jgi:hypothetical protein
MHLSETEQLSTCIECGEVVWPERERAYLINPDDVLCQICAKRRGGVFDELHDRWARSPDLTGLSLSSP